MVEKQCQNREFQHRSPPLEHCGHWEYGRYASGKKAPGGLEDPDFQRKWWKKNGTHPNWLIPNAPDPISGQMRWMDTVVTVSKA